MRKESFTPARNYKERYDLIRHSGRIRSSDVIEGIFEYLSFYDSPDPTLIAAKGTIDGIECIILGQEKKRRGKESKASGMVLAQGFAFVLDMLKEAEERKLPVVSFIDTFGGDSSMKSEMDGQSFMISDCISRYCEVATPTVSFVIGEGGSGGALAMQIADKSFMLENALYSVIAPESCSRIIFHKRLAAGEDIESTLGDALTVLRPGAEHIKEIGMIDEILPEPSAGAHTDYEFTIKTIGDKLRDTLNDWMQTQKGGKKVIRKGIIKKLRKERREKVLNYGRFYDTMGMLAKRKTRRKTPDHMKAIDIEREDFHNWLQIKAHMEREGITDTELYNCEREWDPDTNTFRVAGGCGFVSFHDYVDNYYACPKCGKGEYLSVEEHIEKICDENTFIELEGNLTIKKLVNANFYNTGKYKELLDKLDGKTFSKEGLVSGTAKVKGKDIVLVISDLKFIGGSFGAVFGEKFRRAIEYAVRKNYPLISVNSSGGARMNEGPMALAQMAKMNMAIHDLKKEGVLYLSVISGPTTGGAYASYVTQGDIMIGEKGALVEFAGPRVVMGAGFEVDRNIVCTDKLYETEKIQHLVHRRELKDILSYYVDIYYDLKFPEKRKTYGRIRDFRFYPQYNKKEEAMGKPALEF
ncbi:MAG: carboxyl transferase domain-containing protein [Bacteroidota bacterium]|nr:carboxyl transferase domain-containing protein [Bacteroidota bacterium]